MTDAMELDRVAVIALGNTEMAALSPNDRRLFWKHRVTLTDNKRALLKLLKCAQWDQERQVRQLLELVPRWVNAPVEDALEMLGQHFMHAPIRALAVRSLRGTPDPELLCLLMPLTMALRYDVPEEPHLAEFLLERALENAEVAIALHWYLTTERSAGGQHFQLYTDMMARLSAELQAHHTVIQPGGAPVHEILRRQEAFVSAVGGLMAEAKRYKEPRPKQIERLMAVLGEGGAFSHLTNLPTPVHLPHQPRIEIAGVVAEQSTILKSAMNPVKLTVRTTDGDTHAGLGLMRRIAYRLCSSRATIFGATSWCFSSRATIFGGTS
ncbi:armadillo-type protein [Baffinella frigidus]|nr:armadillo-type protein [Cryptophyta sp. CCMP2293]